MRGIRGAAALVAVAFAAGATLGVWTAPREQAATLHRPAALGVQPVAALPTVSQPSSASPHRTARSPTSQPRPLSARPSAAAPGIGIRGPTLSPAAAAFVLAGALLLAVPFWPSAAQAVATRTCDSKPAALGLQKRPEVGGAVALKTCDGPPNCFSTTGGPTDGSQVDPWLPPKGVSELEAMDQLREVLARYPTDQQGIYAGEFRIVTSEPAYIWSEFEAGEGATQTTSNSPRAPRGTGSCSGPPRGAGSLTTRSTPAT
eukprot:TRINITY_DN3590_c0_g1_i1.p1 TRINITY_DN3590_c0_g1~~TRINITY_DN3590_c0_g1_i1.p1  ORF type:complete len:266 (-),score=23.72 TRINITY_DN3590_c0_g1_i1:273-1049(-)